MAPIAKIAIFDLVFTFSSHQGKDENSFSTNLTYIIKPHLSHPFLPKQFCKNYEFVVYGFSLVQLLVLTLIRDILEQSIN